MRSHELEDLNLLLIRDAAEAPMWLDRWAVSYPSVHTLSVNAHDSIATWQAAVTEAWGNTNRHTVAVVAHGSGALALMAWLYQADILTQKALRATTEMVARRCLDRCTARATPACRAACSG